MQRQQPSLSMSCACFLMNDHRNRSLVSSVHGCCSQLGDVNVLYVVYVTAPQTTLTGSAIDRDTSLVYCRNPKRTFILYQNYNTSHPLSVTLSWLKCIGQGNLILVCYQSSSVVLACKITSLYVQQLRFYNTLSDRQTDTRSRGHSNNLEDKLM